jgi:hypothetical protein
MAKQGAAGKRGPRGPAGPSGPRGARGERGKRGTQGLKGIALGPDADPKRLIKALDIQVEGIYRELNTQMHRMTRVQSQLEEVRAAIRHLASRQRSAH